MFVCLFNRHSYTKLKIADWSKVSITDPDVEKYFDRKQGIEYVMKIDITSKKEKEKNNTK